MIERHAPELLGGPAKSAGVESSGSAPTERRLNGDPAPDPSPLSDAAPFGGVRPLVSRVRDSMTEATHAFQDLAGRLRPHEGLRMSVGDPDVPEDAQLEFPGTAVDAAAQLLLGERGKPTLDEVDPQGSRRGEGPADAGMASQLAMDRRGPV